MRSFVAVLFAGTSLWLSGLPVHADTFGSGGYRFTIDFVNVDNAGNADDSGAGGGSGSSPFGGVAYEYRISTYEIAQGMIDRATVLGMENVTAGAWSWGQPAANISWYEAAAFVNWLNTSQGYHPAYDLTFDGAWAMAAWGVSGQATTGVDTGTNPFRHKDAVYFLPSDDEWYKAAYHKNDGVTDNYWDYPTAENSVPDGIDFMGDTSYEAVFFQGYNDVGPHSIVSVGSGDSAYGTYGQGGNIGEWVETAFDGVTDDSSEARAIFGGFWGLSEVALRSSEQPDRAAPFNELLYIGFRVASVVPEPTTLSLVGLGLLALVRMRLCRRSH